MVHQVRLELAWDAPHAPQTCASTYSATGAYLYYKRIFPIFETDLTKYVYAYILYS